MKITLVGPYFYPVVFGIEKVIYNHAKQLALRGHEVHVVTSNLCFPNGTFTDLPEQEAIENFVVHRLPVLLRTLPPPFYYPSNGGFLIPQLSKVLTALAPDILHAHNIGAAAWANTCVNYAIRHRKKFFYTPHFHPDRLKLGFLRKCFFRQLNHRPIIDAETIFHLTQIDFKPFLEEFPHADAQKFIVLPNGVNPPIKSKSEKPMNAPIKLLFVGRVDDARKGFTILIEAMRLVWAHSQSPVLLSIVGEISQITRDILTTEFADCIRILGAVSEEELEQEYASADLFVMPSLYEGFGMPFIEAMRYRVPVIGTQVGGIPEVVPEQAGILVPPQDAPALAQAITTLVDCAEKRSRMGNAGAAWSKKFYWSEIVEQLETHYLGDRTLSSKSAGMSQALTTSES